MDTGAALATRVAGFAATLRGAGFHIGLAETRDALRLLADPGVTGAAAARAALRALFCGRAADWAAFDALFDAYWLGHRVRARVPVRGPTQTGPQTRRSAAGPGGPPGPLGEGAGPGGAGAPGGRQGGASAAATLDRTDFRHLAAGDLAAAAALAERLAQAMQARLTRRHRVLRHGPRLDLRRTLQAARATGGTPLRLVARQPRPEQWRLAVLVDASGSMGPYSGIFLRFLRGLLGAFDRAEAFLFHTRLVQVSDALADRDLGRALDRLGLMATGVGGGTRIGESLATFNRHHAARSLRGRACAMILSDGYDTGAPEVLAAEMARLRRRCRRIVWLNPLLGWEGYAPVARGMSAALPHVMLFAPAHDLASLKALEPHLARL